MDSDSLLIISGYSVGIFAVSFAGGKLAVLGSMTHTKIQILMSLVAGFILGIAMYHLFPHSLERISGPGNVEKAVAWVVFGMVLMIFLLRVFHFHQHDFSNEAGELYEHQDHEPGDAGGHSHSLVGVAMGLGVHTVTEGVALGTSMRISSPHEDGGALPALGVFLAILLHKPLDAYSIIGMMKFGGYSARARAAANTAFALLCPLVALASFWGVGLLGLDDGSAIGYVLAFAAGAFLCIALSDLMPEIQFHSHDRGKLIASLLVGIALAYGLYFIESSAVHGTEAQHGH
ncbi:MAG: ZIP family metal transporter [Gemmatimonadota bacterium]|nr:ZIP family metal transporter [Gemmatimonadota bacterium]